jgi:hypothetical protein
MRIAAMKTSLKAIVLLFALAGCQPRYSGADAGRLVLEAKVERSTNVIGHVWDPEAFFAGTASCGMTCPIPPLTVPGLPFYEGSVVAGATVAIFDPIAGKPDGISNVTGADGIWEVKGVTSRSNPPMFAAASHDPLALAGKPALSPFGPPFLPTIAPATYVPTFSLRPIATGWAQCLGQVAGLLSNNGILQAVAKFRTSKGMNTQVNDLLDPQKFGGVVVWWSWLPSDSFVRVPAYGTTVTASVGTVLNLNWAPPGTKSQTIQSARGFYVDEAAPVSGIGLTATVLPPGTGFTTDVQFTAVDKVQLPAQGRPWVFPALPPIPVAPGASFGQFPAFQAGDVPAPPKWVCLPGF